jgi:hypothetical protein
MSCRHWSLLALASLVLAVELSKAAEDDTVKADLAALKAAGSATDNKTLLGFIRKRTVSEALRTKIAGLIRDLGHDEYSTRTRAQVDLIDIGGPARPQLRAALADPDAEIRKRAKRALAKIGSATAEANLIAATARVLAARKAPGACATLLDFLPSSEEVETTEEVAAVLPRLALDRDKKADPALLKALSDKYPVKRWAAASALAQAALKDNRAAIVKLLDDPEPSVRRHVAVAMLEVKDKEGIPTLIGLLGSKSAADAELAEDLLVSIAGEKAPPAPDAEAINARDRYRKAWEGWWKDNKGSIDLAKVDLNPVGHGYTVVGVMAGIGKGRVTSSKMLILDPSMKVKWEIENLNYPVYGCLTRRNRALVCEYNVNRVTERDSKGKILFTKNLTGQPVYAQRLPNGNTFIVTRNQLLEVDRSGNAVKTITRSYDIVTAYRHKDGTFSMISSNGQCLKLDSSGRQTGSFTVGYLYYSIGLKVHFLPKGGVVVPDYNRSKVREYDASGKLVREFDAFRPTSVTKLSNGGYLVCSRFNAGLVEYDKNGKQSSTHTVPGTRGPIFAERK